MPVVQRISAIYLPMARYGIRHTDLAKIVDDPDVIESARPLEVEQQKRPAIDAVLQEISTKLLQSFGAPNRQVRAQHAETLRHASSLAHGIERLMKHTSLDAAALIAAFVEAARTGVETLTQAALKEVDQGVHTICQYSLPGQDKKNWHWLLRNADCLNWLRAVGLLPQVRYDEVQRRRLYRHTETQQTTDFADYVVTQFHHGALVDDKDVISIGPGNAIDEESMLKDGNAASVEMIEASEYMVRRLRKKQADLPRKLRKRFIPPEQETDMVIALHERSEAIRVGDKQAVDLVYSHSSLHYFDDPELLEILRHIKSCLKDGGHFACAMKLPGSIFDGVGIPVIRDGEDVMVTTAGAHDRVLRGHMTLNPDGQTRNSRSGISIDALVHQAGFDVIESTTKLLQDFDVYGQKDPVHWLIARKSKPVQRSVETHFLL